jgi:hypothetical protein
MHRIDNGDDFVKITITILFATIGVAPKLVLSAKAGGKDIEGLRKEAFALCGENQCKNVK